MGFKFRKTVRLFPGVKLNFSRSGVSTTLGVNGASVNVKPGRKSRATVGMPGTGISYSETLEPRADAGRASLWPWLVLVAACALLYKLFA